LIAFVSSQFLKIGGREIMTKKKTSVLKQAKEVAGDILTVAAKGAAASVLNVVSEAVGTSNETQSKAKTGEKTASKSSPKSETKAKTASKSAAKSESETKTKAKTAAKSAPKSESKAKSPAKSSGNSKAKK
jgi:RNA polymerase primary sigma factor